MSVSSAQRQFVRQRAGGCCEYCRLSATSGTVAFHVDHIIPRKHGGSSENSNLCLACYNCNAHKGHDLTGFDPQTHLITTLYNPREQLWAEHFFIEDDMQISGLTPEGRTTANLLQFNLDERVESRQTLAELGEYPCKKD